MQHALLEKLGNKTLSREELEQKVKADFSLLPTIMKGVSSPKPAVRYGCGRILMDLSGEHPDKLYPHMGFFVSLLDSKYRILKWVALAVLANLARVDSENRFDAVFSKYYGFLDDEYMVTVANVVGHSGIIALAKPYLVPRITRELLKTEKLKTTPHSTEECRLVIAEKAIISFDVFFDKVEDKEAVLAFVKRHVGKPRKSLKATAEAFLEKWDA
jgi:hypothetical protein